MTINLSDIKLISGNLIEEAYNQGREFGEKSCLIDVVDVLFETGHEEVANVLIKVRRRQMIREALLIKSEENTND